MTYVAVDALLKAVPDTWAVVEFKRLANLQRNQNGDGRASVLSLTNTGALSERDLTSGQQADPSYLLQYWLVSPGDLVVNPMWLAGRAIGVSDRPGAVSPDYRVYEFSRHVHPRYIHHVLRSDAFVDQYRLLMRAETTFDRRITRQTFEGLPIPLPPPQTQRAIADFLDTETARIDALITTKQQLTHLVRERESAYIGRLTTAGDAQSPASLPTVRLRYVSQAVIDTKHATPTVVDGGDYMIVRTPNVRERRLVMAGAHWTDEATYRSWIERGKPEPGDVLLTREAPAGEACVVPGEPSMCIGQRMVLVKLDDRLSGEWLVHSIYSGPTQRFIQELSQGSTVAHLNMSDIADMPVTVPSRGEQERLLGAIRAEHARATAVIDALDRQIELLQEHRQALITAAVAGEVEAPGAAA